MFHNAFLSRTGVALAATGMLMLWGGTANAEEVKCRREIAKSTAKFETAKLKILQKCNDFILKGKLAPGDDCTPGSPNIDQKTGDKLQKEIDKLASSIAKDCESADIALVFPGAECPRFSTADEAAGCNNAVTDAASTATCLECLGETSVDAMIALAYGSLSAIDPSDKADKNVQKCQRSIGKNLEKYFKTVRGSLQKCADAVIKSGSGTCPDSKATDKINKARTKLADKIDSDCGKKEDLNQDDFGGPCFCPGLDVPGSSNCAGNIHTRGDLADCIECIVDHRGSCLTSVTTPGNGALPAECVPTCGNGAIDAGESCDDGNADNGDSCPSDCSINPCNNPGGTVTGTVSIAGTAADLSALTIFVTYPDGDVRIPGQGADASVFARVLATNGTADATPNDLDYGVRVLMTDAFFPLGGSPLEIQFDVCDGASVADADFDCWVEFVADSQANILRGVTCSVDVP
jgi:cysteine-rich repeat protein